MRTRYKFPLEDRVAIVTGGADGIGGGCSTVFYQDGNYSVAILDKNKQRGEERAHNLDKGRERGKAIALRCDVANEDQLRKTINTAVKHFGGKLHTVVANAGWHPPDRDICDVPLDEVLKLMRLNFGGTYNAFKFGVTHMRQSGIGDGSLIALGSMAGEVGQKNASDYSATKGAQRGLVLSLADSLAPGIRVNIVEPANVDTPLMRSWIESTSDPAATRKAVDEKAQPIGRMATPEEIGQVCLELSLNRFRTKEVIMPHGGALTYQR